RQLRHPRLVTEDGAAADLRRWVDSQHRDPMALPNQMQPERLDETGFADPGRAGDAEADRLAGRWQQLVEERGGFAAMIGARRLDERDGAGERAAVTRDDALREVFVLWLLRRPLRHARSAPGPRGWP